MVTICQCSPESPLHLCSIINSEEVKIALERLVKFDQKKPPSTLLNLKLVDELMNDPHMPCSTQLREFVFATFLTDVIQGEFNEVRRVLNRGYLLGQADRDSALNSICEDAQMGSIELLGWEWLYYRFVRVDLNIGHREFARQACIDERTLQRYQTQAIFRLTMRLIEMERQARRRLSYREGETECKRLDEGESGSHEEYLL